MKYDGYSATIQNCHSKLLQRKKMLHMLRSGIFTKKIRTFPYKLQMATSLTEDRKIRRNSLAQYC